MNRSSISPVFRRLFALASALSALLCVATCVLWVRSKFVRDQVDFVKQRDLPRGAWMWRVWEAGSYDLQLLFGTGHRGYYSLANIRYFKAIMTAKNRPLWRHHRVVRGGTYFTVEGRYPNLWNRLGFYAEQRWDTSWGCPPPALSGGWVSHTGSWPACSRRSRSPAPAHGGVDG